MNIPLYKIAYDKQGKQLRPNRPGVNFKSNKIIKAQKKQKIIESLYPDVGNSIKTNQGKQEIIKEHVKTIQPKILSDFGLVRPPGFNNFEYPEKKRQAQQPVKIIRPAGIKHLINEVVGVAGKRINEKLRVSRHERNPYLAIIYN